MLISALLVLFISWRLIGQSALDFHAHDTYIIVPTRVIIIPILFYIFLMYFCYQFIRRKNGNTNLLISVFQIIGLCLLSLSISIPTNYQGLVSKPRRYYDYTVWKSFNEFISDNWYPIFAILLFIISQLIFLIYFLLCVFKMKNKSPNA